MKQSIIWTTISKFKLVALILRFNDKKFSEFHEKILKDLLEIFS